MKDKGITSDAQLAQLAEVSGVSITRLFRNEAGAKTVSAVAKALGINDPGRPLREETDRRWLTVGQRIRERFPEKYARTLRYLEAWLEVDEMREMFVHDYSRATADDGDR
jgi:hypothetical protein